MALFMLISVINVYFFLVQLQQLSFTELYNRTMIKTHNFLSTMTTNNTSEEGSEQKET